MGGGRWEVEEVENVKEVEEVKKVNQYSSPWVSPCPTTACSGPTKVLRMNSF